MVLGGLIVTDMRLAGWSTRSMRLQHPYGDPSSETEGSDVLQVKSSILVSGLVTFAGQDKVVLAHNDLLKVFQQKIKFQLESSSSVGLI